MKNPLFFLSKLNDGGLLFLNHYLEKRCHCNVFHITPSKRLIYDGEKREECQKLKNKICNSKIAFQEFHYDPDKMTLIYQFRINESHQYLVFFPVKEERCSFIYDEISEIIMPLSYYLKGLYYSYENYKRLLHNESDRIFQRDSDYWCGILRSMQIDLSSLIRVAVIDPGSHKDKLEKIQRMVSNFCLQDGDIDILIYNNQDKIILVIPSRYQLGLSEEARDQHTEPMFFPLYKHHALLEEHFGEGIRISVGRRVQIRDVYTSYFQSLAALFYLDYFRKSSKLIEFKNIGPAVHTMQLDLFGTEKEIEEKYRVLSNYENERGGFLFTTLRELIRCQFNYQDAAKRLHMHLNTLYYRQDKLSSILGMDLTQLESKIILYEEIFTYDFIRFYKNGEMQ